MLGRIYLLSEVVSLRKYIDESCERLLQVCLFVEFRVIRQEMRVTNGVK